MHKYAALGGDGTALSQHFYREYCDDLLYAAGLDGRPLVAGDQALVEAAFVALGWTLRQQRMFVDGAPAGSITPKLQRALRKTLARSGPTAA